MVNVGGILTAVTRKRLRNSFGIICASHCVGDTLVGLVTLGWCSTLVMFMNHDWSQSSLAYGMCVLVQIGTYGVIYTHLVQSVNRLVAICWPYVYHEYFTIKRTSIAIGVVWVVSCAQCVIYLMPSCHVYYDAYSYMWSYSHSDCGANMGFYLDFVYNTLLNVALFACDFVTFCNIRRYRRNVDREAESSPASLAGGREAEEKKTVLTKSSFMRDMRFLIQGLIYTAMYVGFAISGQFIGDISQSAWPTRLGYGTLMWICATIVDGVVVVVFNYTLDYVQSDVQRRRKYSDVDNDEGLSENQGHSTTDLVEWSARFGDYDYFH